MRQLDIAVVGGSLGGLTAACLLRDAGHHVTVYERSAQPLEQRGAGIGFLPASYRYLADRARVDLASIAVATDRIRYLDRDGSVAAELSHRYLFSSWNTVYRHLLDQWLQQPGGPEAYRLGHEMTDFVVLATGEQSQVEVRFDAAERVRAELLVCADGVGSMARARLQPAAQLNYAGYVAWRGVVPEGELSPATRQRLGDAITYHVYANSHILAYPIPALDGSVAPGERLINFVWYRNYLHGGDLDDLMTDRNGARRTASVPPGEVGDHHVAELRAVAEARLPAPLAEVVVATAEPFIQVIYDIEVERMAFGPVCLLGDAAFVVRPHAAAGSAKACEDGWRLAAELGTRGDPGAALAAWESSQLALGRSLLERTRAIGRKSQSDNSWRPDDPEQLFGLYRAGDA